MGSLMAGWDSHYADPKSIKFERNRSMTKDEIETYWRSKKKKEELELHLDGDEKQIEKVYRRSSSLPITKQNSVIETGDGEDEDGKEDRVNLFNKHGWWINSRWAFLNEPPVIASETPFRYASQFHVTKEHVNNSDHHHAAAGGIIT